MVKAHEAAKLPEQVIFLCRRYSPDEKRKDPPQGRILDPLVGDFLFGKSMSTVSSDSLKIKKIATLAVFCAIAYLSLFVFRISEIGGFLTFDIKDTIVALAAMIYGPVSGVVISFIVALIEMLTVSGTGPWGFLMNFVSTAVFVSTASLGYMYFPKIKKTISGALVGLFLSVIATTAVMMVMNLLVTPIYYGVPRSAVVDMLLPLLLPFNLIKYILNASAVLVLYKPIKEGLRRAKLIAVGAENYKFGKMSVILTVVGVLLIVICVVLLIVSLGGSFQIIKPNS